MLKKFKNFRLVSHLIDALNIVAPQDTRFGDGETFLFEHGSTFATHFFYSV
jgi:hypothetical protein